MKHVIKYGVALVLVQYLILSGVVAGIDVRPGKTEASVSVSPGPTASPTLPIKQAVTSVNRSPSANTPGPVNEMVPNQQVPVVEIQPTSVPDPTAAPPPDPQLCIITVHGTRYNVTEFRAIHSGGDIFTCGADMTGVFDSQHSMGTLRRMAPYAVN